MNFTEEYKRLITEFTDSKDFEKLSTEYFKLQNRLIEWNANYANSTDNGMDKQCTPTGARIVAQGSSGG